MIHLDTAGPPCIILMGRGYDGVPQDQPAHHHRLDFTSRWDVIWYPLDKHAEIAGLLGELSKADMRHLVFVLQVEYGVTSLSWVRASGKKVCKVLSDSNKWITDKEKSGPEIVQAVENRQTLFWS